jgi:hypothetical protein
MNDASPQAQPLPEDVTDFDPAIGESNDDPSDDFAADDFSGAEIPGGSGPIDAAQLSDTVQSRQQVISTGHVAAQDDSGPFEPGRMAANDSTADAAQAAALPPWPIMTVDIKDAPSLVHSEMESFTRRLEELACAIAKKQVDDHEYREFAQRRALYWDR